MQFTVYGGLAALPHFNPDLDDEARPPAPVKELRGLIAQADAVVISTPEYAHGLPGSLKNALDWIVSSGELRGKPVLLINASPGGGERAQASLVGTLQVMEARLLESATVRVASIRSKLDAEGNVSDAGTVKALEAGLAALVSAIEGA
jgi:chromate reductase